MTNPSRPSVPDPWAQARRIAAEWEAAGRGVDRATQVARVREARARRTAAMSESRIKAAVDKAVSEALAKPKFAESVDQLAQAAAPVSVAAQAPEKLLHEMAAEEWEAQRLAYWGGKLTPLRRPMTLGELTRGRYDGEA